MRFGCKKEPKPLGYSVLAAGESHRCELPSASRLGRGASIQCDECGRVAEVAYNGMIGNYWTGPMSDNT